MTEKSTIVKTIECYFGCFEAETDSLVSALLKESKSHYVTSSHRPGAFKMTAASDVTCCY